MTIEHYFVFKGQKDVVDSFEKGLIELGLFQVEIDTIQNGNFGSYSKNSDIDAGRLSKMNMHARDDSKYAISSDMIMSILGLMGTTGIAGIITNVLNSHKGEGSVEFNQEGNITKVTFKDMNPKKVPEMLAEISELVRKEEKQNKNEVSKDSND